MVRKALVDVVEDTEGRPGFALPKDYKLAEAQAAALLEVARAVARDRVIHAPTHEAMTALRAVYHDFDKET